MHVKGDIEIKSVILDEQLSSYFRDETCFCMPFKVHIKCGIHEKTLNVNLTF